MFGISFWLATGCGAPSTGHTNPGARPAPLASSRPYLRIIEARCADCHDGTERISLTEASLRQDPKLALKAALMVSAERMPPSPLELVGTDRDVLLCGLCSVGAPDPAACFQALGGAPRISPVLAASEWLRVIDAQVGAAGPPDQPTVGEVLLRSHDAVGSLDSILAPALDPTYAAALLVVAAERCAARDGHEPDQADYDRCMGHVLDVELARPPQHAAHRDPSTSAGCP